MIKFYPLEKIVLDCIHLRMIEDKDAGGILAMNSHQPIKGMAIFTKHLWGL